MIQCLTYIFKTVKLVVEMSESCKELMDTDKGIPSLGSAEVRLEHVMLYQEQRSCGRSYHFTA